MLLLHFKYLLSSSQWKKMPSISNVCLIFQASDQQLNEKWARKRTQWKNRSEKDRKRRNFLSFEKIKLLSTYKNPYIPYIELSYARNSELSSYFFFICSCEKQNLGWVTIAMTYLFYSNQISQAQYIAAVAAAIISNWIARNYIVCGISRYGYIPLSSDLLYKHFS